MFTCVIRYQLAPGKREPFRQYAQAWIGLIRKYGGTHHGYFLPGGQDDELPKATFSFPGLGKDGPPDVALALFSFPDVEAYERYRRDVAQDEDCKRATERFEAAPSFTSYERTFLVPMFD